MKIQDDQTTWYWKTMEDKDKLHSDAVFLSYTYEKDCGIDVVNITY